MKFYLQVNQNNIITDCIEYPYQDYIEFEGEVPQAVHGGWFKLIDGEIIEIPELKPIGRDEEIEELKQLVADLAELVLMGGM